MTSKNTKSLPTLAKLSEHDKDVRVFALGGLGEVGKNMYCIQVADELMIIDSGILFPDNDYGVDYIIQDYTYLKDNESKIVGLFITHGHEDHIGGIPYLLRNVTISKVYSSGLASGLIMNKMKEFNNIPINIIEYSHNSVFKFKNFEVSFFRTNHSIPDSFGLAIKTKIGYILHSGDFKFDLTPLGHHTDFAKLTKYSEYGVKLLLSDSTNANVKNFTTSEKKIGDSIKSIFSTIKGRVMISTFASNVHRVQQIVEASVEVGRKVIVFGRSMEKTINVGQQLKYITAPAGTFINAKQFPHLPPEKITILSTGSQGEPLAALSRIADGSHKTIKIIPGDTIVFSSSAIPGNQEGINRTINKLYRAGAHVIVNSPLTDTHTSGHASETELKFMLALTQPEYFMPIHGEYSMLKKHTKLAMETGVKEENCFIMKNGDVLTVSEKKAQVNASVKAGDIYIDEAREHVDPEIIKQRQILSEDGMLSIIFAVDKSSKQRKTSTIISRGFIYMKNSEELVNKIKVKADYIYDKYFAPHSKANPGFFKNSFINELSSYIYELTERRPMIIPIIMKY